MNPDEFKFEGLKYHEGCNKNPVGCFGPWEDFYTLFDIEIWILSIFAIVSILVGVAIYFVLHQLNKKQIINIHFIISLFIALCIAFLLFYILMNVFIFNNDVIY